MTLFLELIHAVGSFVGDSVPKESICGENKSRLPRWVMNSIGALELPSLLLTVKLVQLIILS